MHIASASSNSLPLIKLTLILIEVSSFFNGLVTTAKKLNIIIFFSLSNWNLLNCLKEISIWNLSAAGGHIKSLSSE